MSKITVYKNQDKEYLKTDKWEKGRHLLNIPQMRAAFISKPNGGKTNLVLNIIANSNYDKVFIIHPDPNSHDYDRIKSAIRLDEIPAPDEWDELKEEDEKCLCILDDIEISLLSKQQLVNLQRLYGYVSSHKNIHPILCYQSWIDLPKFIRKIINVIVIWKLRDKYQLNRIGTSLGFEKGEFKALCNMMQDDHDFIFIDQTKGSPAPIRFNGTEIIDPE